MNGFQRILFPVDFSQQCEDAVPYVKEMVRSFNAELTLLHVVEIPAYLYGAMPPSYPAAWASFDWESFETIYRNDQPKLTSFACTHFNDLTKTTAVKAVCERGDPGYGILEYAEKNGSDLIMIPTHGHGAFHAFLLGSTTTRVLHRAKCPVWTGAHIENESAKSHAQIKNILCAIDLEKESAHVVESAMALALKFSAKLRLMHRIPVSKCGPVESFSSPFDCFLADAAREQMAKIQKTAGTDLEVCVQGGSICQAVADAAARYLADLVVIGRGHVQAPLSRLRTNGYAIIREATCPVLSV